MKLQERVSDLLDKGYQVLGMQEKTWPPKGVTGKRPEWVNEYFANTDDPNFLAIRFSPGTCGIDIDTDPGSGHSVESMDYLRTLWMEFRATFDFNEVRTGANTANVAGIYHFKLDEGMTEEDVKLIKIDNLDVLRKSHRFAVVRGTHPTTGNRYRGELPGIDELPVLTTDMLTWLLERSAASKPNDLDEYEAADMPELQSIPTVERRFMSFQEDHLDDHDWGMPGGRKAMLFGAVQRLYKKAVGTPEVKMGKALTYIEPYVEACAEFNGDAWTRSIDHFWKLNKLGEFLTQQKSYIEGADL